MSRADEIREALERLRKNNYAMIAEAKQDQELIHDAAYDYADLLEQLVSQTRLVMGQDDDGTPNGQDYIESRLAAGWARELE